MVLSKWMRSLKYGNDYFKLVDNDAYFENYNVFIKHILNKKGVIVRLAVLTEDRDVVLGWSVFEGPILHFVHVHKDMRKQGIGTSLVPRGMKVITHLTKIGLSIWASKYQDVIFNPFA